MKNNLSPTERYLQENRYVNELKRCLLMKATSKFQLLNDLKRYIPRQAVLLYKSARAFLEYVVIDLIFNYKSILNLVRLKNSKINKSALVIGNGPSQGFLSYEFLNKFKNSGGETFVVNYWQVNESFCLFVPDFIVISDPATLNFNEQELALSEKNASLLAYLNKNHGVNIICPLNRVSEMVQLFGKERVIGFVDTELRDLTSNIWPIFPRGYVSMTLYKALAMSTWFGYSNIYVIGMDNTYPRNIYSDKNNSKLILEVHSGIADYVTDHTCFYPSMGALMDSIASLFHDAHKFKKYSQIKNLDLYSLTDSFKKIEINNVFD